MHGESPSSSWDDAVTAEYPVAVVEATFFPNRKFPSPPPPPLSLLINVPPLSHSPNRRVLAAMFSAEQRYHALGLMQEGYTQAATAQIMRCSVTSLRRWTKYWERDGSVWRDPDFLNKHWDAAAVDKDLELAVLSLVHAEPVAFLKDHVKLLKRLKAVNPDYDCVYTSASTVYRVLRKNNFTRKRVERLFSERVLADQIDFAQRLSEIPLRCIVSVDETHKSGDDCFRKYGRSPRNEKCVLLDRDPRTIPRTSTIMAVSMSGGVHWAQTVRLGPAQTADDWRLFLQALRPRMSQRVPGHPWALQPDACVLLFDNAAIHDAAGDAYLHNNGMHFIRLPPYSPNLQPIEGVFRDLKRHIESLCYYNPLYFDFPLTLVATAVSLLTHRQIYGQFICISNNLSSLLVQGA